MLATADRVRVFWQPGCTSCQRTKEFLARNGVEFVFAQTIGDVIKFLDLDVRQQARLSPVALERAVWHPAQHVRQLILETLGIQPARPLSAADLAGLPLPEKAWDED